MLAQLMLFRRGEASFPDFIANLRSPLVIKVVPSILDWGDKNLERNK